MKPRGVVIAFTFHILTPGCNPPVDLAEPVVYPRLLAADREAVLARLGEEPHATLLARLEERAARPLAPEADPDVWDHDAWGRNGETAMDAALLAWLHDDEEAAAHARDLLAALETDFETNETWDVNIRMPHPLIGYTSAVDLLRGTPFLTEEEALEAEARITTITGAFFDRYVEDDQVRQTVLGFAQNNHPIRTAAAIGYVALAFPDHPDAEEWADWAFSELDYLWGPPYVQPDGGVAEGPFYYGFALGPTLAVFRALENVGPRVFHRDCRNRQDTGPWTGHGCVDGEAFTMEEPLARLGPTIDWWISLRLPSGHCPPLADAYFNPLNGAALVPAPHRRWSWEHNADRPFETGHGMDLLPDHLLYLPDVAPAEPEWTTRFLPDAGQAVLRSGWETDALWLMLVAEHGGARKTLHDHVDGTSFSMAAYGEYLLVDPGYYKPNELDNARTSAPQAHNVVLVDGRGAPDKGLLSDFGDADAFLQNTVDAELVDHAEARQGYEGLEIVRSALLVRDRYFVIADRIATSRTDTRSFAWRLGGWAGYDAGGVFELHEGGATWERARAGVEVHLASTVPGLSVVEPAFDAEDAPHVHRFELDRSVSTHGVVDGVVQAVAPDFLAVLAPYPVGEEPPAVTPLDLQEGLAGFSVDGDLVLLREPGSPTTIAVPGGATVETDAVFVLVGADLAVLGHGTFLELDGVAPGGIVTVP